MSPKHAKRSKQASLPHTRERQLPKELVLQILGLLDTNTLLSRAALVCKDWRDLTRTEELLKTVEVSLRGSEAALVARLERFVGWLVARAAPHVRWLRIVMPDMSPPVGPDGPDPQAQDEFDQIDAHLGAAFQVLARHRRVSCVTNPGARACWAPCAPFLFSRTSSSCRIMPHHAAPAVFLPKLPHTCLCAQLEDLSVSVRMDGLTLSAPRHGWAEALGPCLRRLRLDMDMAILESDARLQVSQPVASCVCLGRAPWARQEVAPPQEMRCTAQTGSAGQLPVSLPGDQRWRCARTPGIAPAYAVGHGASFLLSQRGSGRPILQVGLMSPAAGHPSSIIIQ